MYKRQAHDLRTPVTAIQGYTQMLLQSPELSEEDLDAAVVINERLNVLKMCIRDRSKLVDAIEVAKATKQIVMQNIVIALGIKSVFLILGALGIVGMWEARCV